MQPAGNIEAVLDGRDDFLRPTIGQLAPCIDHADNHCLRARFHRLGDGHIRNAEIRLAARQTELPQTPFRPPVDNPLGSLGGELVRHIAEKHQIRLFERHRSDLSWKQQSAEPRTMVSLLLEYNSKKAFRKSVRPQSHAYENLSRGRSSGFS